MAALTQKKAIPALFLVGSPQGREALRALNVERVLATSGEPFDTKFQQLAEQLKTTAVFDGVGGELISRIAPHLPADTTISLYGFPAGLASIFAAVYLWRELLRDSRLGSKQSQAMLVYEDLGRTILI